MQLWLRSLLLCYVFHFQTIEGRRFEAMTLEVEGFGNQQRIDYDYSEAPVVTEFNGDASLLPAGEADGTSRAAMVAGKMKSGAAAAGRSAAAAGRFVHRKTKGFVKGTGRLFAGMVEGGKTEIQANTSEPKEVVGEKRESRVVGRGPSGKEHIARKVGENTGAAMAKGGRAVVKGVRRGRLGIARGINALAESVNKRSGSSEEPPTFAPTAEYEGSASIPTDEDEAAPELPDGVPEVSVEANVGTDEELQNRVKAVIADKEELVIMSEQPRSWSEQGGGTGGGKWGKHGKRRGGKGRGGKGRGGKGGR